MKKSVAVYIQDILEAIAKIEDYTIKKSFSKTDFLDDVQTQDSVLRRLEIIGEASRKIPLDFRQQHPQIPWKAMVGLRDVLIHGYDQVNIHRVWQVIIKDLPQLKIELLKI
ncbi:MAG: DUF86 domain-containing protein [Patescibacteria group bacterium]